VRVRSTRSGEWSFWCFFSPQAEYLGNASRRGSAIFLTPVDLNVFGLSFGESVDRIQIANMTTSDRLDVRGIPVAKKGVVVTGREGENLARPDPNFKALAQFEEGNKFGPDILYVASLQYIANR